MSDLYTPRMLEIVPDNLKMQRMCDAVVTLNPYALRYVPDHLKKQKMGNKAVDIEPNSLSLIVFGRRACATRQLRQIHRTWTMFQITLSPRRCVKRQWPKTHTY